MNLGKLIDINWYMEHKPYEVSSEIDIFYLKICRDLYLIIDGIANKDEGGIDMTEEDCREMAYIFTAYFEDQVSEIGFWKSLTDLHQKQFGKRLPFFDNEMLRQQVEDWDDILPADIHYLAYISYLNFLTHEDEKPVVLFNTPFLIELTQQVFDYLNNIEEVLVTDYYKHFLVPGNDYIDFKKQLTWFTFNGYLTATEFSRKLDYRLWRLLENETDKSQISPLMYAEQDHLLFQIPSTLTAFFPLDILAGAMHCNEMKKQEISNLKWRPHGIFHIQRETKKHYRFLHTSTGEEFDVLKKSLDNPIDHSMHEYWITTLAKWNNDYYVSGLCAASPLEGEEIYHYNLKMQHSFQKHHDEYRHQIMETAINYRNEAAKYFGSDLVVFNSGYQLQKILNEFNQWYFDVAADKSKLTSESKPVKFKLPREILACKKIALFIPPTDGLQFIIAHGLILEVLQTKATDKVSVQDMSNVLAMLPDDSVGADYWLYLKKNFPIPNLSLFFKCPLNSDVDFDALLRIYRPEDFSPLKLPRFSTFTSERVSPETASGLWHDLF